MKINRIDRDILGQRLRDARKAAGISQARLAELTGIDQRQISRYEHGQICGYDKYKTLSRNLKTLTDDV